ncbi:hypothetical protein CALVIDRAFT_542770 [Calocera viscosa TUFC12733]|uniref:F-box domain-containing protein n=1 Tax=Calocera viscosa (strain TUFC12733) TaxID=1330018 RepID=A0A167GAV2_CALVF|nr:hypothetical protein CALVIDRAFT_542770 [Calocera viscosa TUFC12733]
MNVRHDPDSAPSAGPSPFIKVARIPELLDLVLKELPATALASLAPTCRLLFEPTARTLWSTGEDDLLHHLLDLLPSDVLVRSSGEQPITLGFRFRGLRKSDMERFHLYSRFIHELRFKQDASLVELDDVRMLHHFVVNSHFLPNLTSVTISFGSHNFLLAHLLLSPSVRYLSLSGRVKSLNESEPRDRAVSSLLEWLPDRCPKLESFTTDRTRIVKYIEGTSVSPIFRRLPCLHTVEIRKTTCSASLVELLAELPCLHNLHVNHFVDSPNHPWSENLPHPPGGRSFHALQKLEFGGSLEVCHAIVKCCPELRRLLLGLVELNVLVFDEFGSLVRTLQSHGNLQHLTLLFDFATLEPSAVWTTLQSLSSLPIRSFRLEAAWDDDVASGTEQVFQLVCSWEGLRSLNLQLPSPTEGDKPLELSMLVHLFQHCRHLEELELEQLWYGGYEEESWDACRSKLARLTIDQLHMSISVFAQFLCLVCPEVQVFGFSDADVINEQLKMVRFAREGDRRRKL